MKDLHLTIVSPEEELFSGAVESVTLPGMVGSFTILPQHAPIVSSLKAGQLSYVTKDGEEHVQDIHGGFIEMSNNDASVCVD
ncbi:MAG: ATP synthase F1 subunit epsilon [Bacteroides sp.]|nr:ATP synthase F1 subunit epsilon [Bacteroides sp.]